MARNIGIAGIQMQVLRGQDNTERMLQQLNTVAALFPWVDIICFSELCMSGLDMKLAMPIPNSSLDRFMEWAQKNGKWIIPGSFYEKAKDKIYNTALVISPNGEIVARYRKIFPWRPLEAVEPGEEFCFFDIPQKGRFGLCICYDIWFPELIRSLAWMGAEAVICPTATYTSDRTQELVMARANAISNQLYLFNINGLGVGGIGQSIFVDPEGRILQTAGESEMVMTEIIDLDHTTRVREYGTMGQCQIWKALGDFKGQFPVYRQDMRKGEIFKTIGPLKLHKKSAD